MLRYEARRVLPAPVEDVWAVLAEPARWSEWWPGLVSAEPTVRRALAPGALWQLEGTNRASFLRRPQMGGTDLLAERRARGFPDEALRFEDPLQAGDARNVRVERTRRGTAGLCLGSQDGPLGVERRL